MGSEMCIRDSYLLMQNLCQWVKYSLINSRNWIHVISDVNLHAYMTPLTAEDRLLINKDSLQTEKGWTVDNMIVECPVRQWKWHMLFDLVRILNAKRLSGSDRRRLE